jgi:hypothetical protein
MVRDPVILGTPDKVVDELLAFREKIGGFAPVNSLVTYGRQLQ